MVRVPGFLIANHAVPEPERSGAVPGPPAGAVPGARRPRAVRAPRRLQHLTRTLRHVGIDPHLEISTGSGIF